MEIKNAVSKTIDLISVVGNSYLVYDIFRHNVVNELVDDVLSANHTYMACFRGMTFIAIPGMRLILPKEGYDLPQVGLNACGASLGAFISSASIGLAMQDPSYRNIGVAVADTALTIWGAYQTFDSGKGLRREIKDKEQKDLDKDDTTAKYSSLTDRLKDLGSKAIGFAKNKTTEYMPAIQRTASAFY
ncbi:hypothetical protein HOC35_03040 [Candidatus Woesearchaeota archaeon]|jgi:hypothetical protein|nr:hypothetical protein [Candidatus Woesearchaeota archaeon]